MLPTESDATATECKEFETQWIHVLENGEKNPVEVPGKIPAESGEIVTLTTILPREIESGDVLPALFLNGIVPLYAPDTTGVPIRIFI